MSDPKKPNPNTPKRSRRKPAMEPLGWDEIVSQPGMGGYLSFLNGPVPLPHLTPAPGVDSIPDRLASTPVVETMAHIEPTPDLGSIPQLESAPQFESTPVIQKDPLPNPQPPAQSPRVPSAPVVVSIPELPRRPRIRKCVSAQDGHSLGEEVLYQALWKAAAAESLDTRTITIGWRGMSQLCRMTPKNCKINTQRLLRKLALEVLSPYNTPESIGTTYRVHSVEAILRRRRQQGLEWVVRSRGVEFVNPATGVGVTAHLCSHVPE